MIHHLRGVVKSTVLHAALATVQSRLRSPAQVHQTIRPSHLPTVAESLAPRVLAIE